MENTLYKKQETVRTAALASQPVWLTSETYTVHNKHKQETAALARQTLTIDHQIISTNNTTTKTKTDKHCCPCKSGKQSIAW